MAGPGAEENIDILRRTYLQLFSSILSKKNLDTEQKRMIYKNLQSFLYEKVLKPDEFSNHIPEFAKMLSVPDKALSGYLANNFQKALIYIKGKDLPLEQTSAAVEDGGSKGDKITSSQSVLGSSKAAEFLEELIHHTGFSMKPGSRFIPLSLGIMKFVDGSSETQGKSAEGLIGKETPVISEGEQSADKKSRPEVIKVVHARNEKKQAVLEKEQSIIEELLKKFGNVLDIHGKLTPQIGPVQEGAPEITDESSTSENKSKPEIVKVVHARNEKKQTVLEKEQSIIEELLKKFGNVLDIQNKLTPQIGAPGDAVPAAAPLPVEEKKEELILIITKFQSFYNVTKKIREFQVKNDRTGYNDWLNKSDGITKAIVGVRNANLKFKKGIIFDLKEEFIQLSRQAGYDVPRLEDLKNRMDQFEKIQIVLGKLMEDAKGQGNVFINSFRPVWSEIQLLFDEPETLPKTQFALKKILKKVQSPALRTAMEEIVIPHLKNAAKIYAMEKLNK